MKKLWVFTAALALSCLVGCGNGGNSYTVPTTSFEKVKTAFSGVERSFDNVSSRKNRIVKNKAIDEGPKTVLDSLYSTLTSSDNMGDVIDDLSYTQPPMIQFQCLKFAFDHIGESYSFGTKYFDEVSGTVYVDFETGFEGEKTSEYLYNYSFNLGLSIQIDADDLITADVSFGITLSKGNDSYHTDWYVNMALDYDMNNESPTYKLLMLTANDETGLPFFDYFVYEYDYVEVNNNSIVEWRKFDLETTSKLVKDSNHQTFDSYATGEMGYRVGSFAWYKDNMLKKAKDIEKEEERQLRVANLFFELGLNATDIDREPFYNKTGTRNNVIQTMYQEFSRLFKKDIIYSLVTRDKDDYQGNEPVRIEIADYKGNLPLTSDYIYTSNSSVKFSDLVTDPNAYHEECCYIPLINLLNEEGGIVRQATLDDLSLAIVIDDRDPINVNMQDNVVTTLSRYETSTCSLVISLVKDKEVIDSASILICCGEFSDYFPFWPVETLKELGLNDILPIYKSRQYDARVGKVTSTQEDNEILRIDFLNNSEQDNEDYDKVLQNSGFISIGKEPYYEYLFVGSANRIYTLSMNYSEIVIKYAPSRYQIAYSDEDKAIFSAINQDVLLTEGHIFEHPHEQKDIFQYYGVTQNEFSSFIQGLTNNGWTKQDTVYYLDLDGTRYKITADYSPVLCLISYSTEDAPNDGGLETATIYIKSKIGNFDIPMGHDVQGRLFTTYSFEADSTFQIIGGFDKSVVLGYNDLEMNEVATTYLTKGSSDSIKVLVTVNLLVTIISSDGVNKIVCTIPGEGEEEPTTTYSIVGQFNEWDATSGLRLEYNSESNFYYISNFIFQQGEGFVIITNGDWTQQYFGYSNLGQSYDFVSEGETNGIVPNRNFSAGIRFQNGLIFFTNIDGQDEVNPFNFTTASLIGTFNDWNEQSTANDFILNNGQFVAEIDLVAGDEFKIVFDHSWNSCLGYDDIQDIADYKGSFEKENEHGNIRAIIDLHLIVRISNDNGSLKVLFVVR